jgi:hypothetical protein
MYDTHGQMINAYKLVTEKSEGTHVTEIGPKEYSAFIRLRLCSIVDSCEHDNENSDSLKAENFTPKRAIPWNKHFVHILKTWSVKQASHPTNARQTPTIICSDILTVGSHISAFSLKRKQKKE